MHLFSTKRSFRVIFLYAALCLTLASKASAVSTNLAITNWGEEGTVRCYDTVTDVWNDENGWLTVWCWGCDCRWESSYMWWVKTLEVSGTTNGCPIQVTVGFVYGHQETFNITGNGGSVYLSFYWQNDDWSQDPVTASASEECGQQGSIELLSVDGADYLGDDGDDGVYATAATGGSVTISLTGPPEMLSEVIWEGGDNAGVAQRTVSKDEPDRAYDIRAMYRGIKIRGFKVKVFNAPPTPGTVIVEMTISQNDGLVANDGSNVGRAERNVGAGTAEFGVYYANKKFKFTFQKLTYPGWWGVNGWGRGDVTDPNNIPIGIGFGFLTSQHDRKVRAKADLTPPTQALSYWSSHIVEVHERFHLSDYLNGFHIPKMLEAESWIESLEVPAGVFDTASGTLESKRIEFWNKIVEKTNEATAAYDPEHEERAYAVSDPLHQALSDSIHP